MALVERDQDESPVEGMSREEFDHLVAEAADGSGEALARLLPGYHVAT